MTTTWHRIESTARSIDLESGVQARTADALWMLARQWRVAEFRGDDAAQPIAARVVGYSLPLTGLTGSAGEQQPLGSHVPLEALVEAAPAPDDGAAGLHAAACAARRLFRLLDARGLGAAIGALREAFPLSMPERLVALGNPGTAAAALLVRHGLDARALARAPVSRTTAALSGGLGADEVSAALAVIEDWRAWFAGRDGRSSDLAWDAERLEHAFTVEVAGVSPGSVALELRAPEHDGGHLDWYTFDVASENPAAVTGAPLRRKTALPIPVRYRGMPAARWWQFEEGDVNFGDLEAGPGDLARLLVAEYAGVYSGDWFVVPVKVPLGSVTEITRLEVIDNFGSHHDIESTAHNDAARGSERPWRMFELRGDELTAEHRAPWLLVPPTSVADTHGPVLERVIFARDEGANLAWAVEISVEGPLGRAVQRADAWQAAYRAPPAAPSSLQPTAADGDARERRDAYAEQWLRYRVEAPAAPWWVPLLPEPTQPNSSQVRLRRARMRAWEALQTGPARRQVGPQSTFLDARRARRFAEEEVQHSGICVERRWTFARWHDGSIHLWLQRQKRAGRGEHSSGLRWDMLEAGTGRSPGERPAERGAAP